MVNEGRERERERTKMLTSECCHLHGSVSDVFVNSEQSPIDSFSLSLSLSLPILLLCCFLIGRGIEATGQRLKSRNNVLMTPIAQLHGDPRPKNSEKKT